LTGTGWVASQHVNAFENNPHTHVVAMVSSSKESADKKRGEWGLDEAAVYADLNHLLADPKVDIVSIATPNHLHAQAIIQSAEAGKHILIEKPPAIYLTDLHTSLNVVKKSGVKTVVSFVLRWNPLVKTIKKLLQQDAIGPIFFAQLDYWHNSGRAARIPNHWTTRKDSGGSAFLTGGNHAVDALRWLVDDEIVEVSAAGTQISDLYEYPPNMLAWVKFANGAIGKVSAILEGTHPYQFNIDLLGQHGTIRDNHLWSPKTFVGQNDWITIPTITPNSGDVTHHPFQDEVNHFIDCILTNQESYVNLDDAVKTIEVCIAIDRSAESGLPVKFPLS